MEVDSGFHYLLQNLRLEDPWIPPKNWESIASECGAERSSSPVQLPNSIYDACAVSEASLVRLVINALNGVKSAIVEIDKLSQYFCSIPADRTFNRVPSLWCRSSSTHALGNMLKAIGHTGLLFFFLNEFVEHYLHTDCNVNLIASENIENFRVQLNDVHTNKIVAHSSYSLINQAFAAGVAKLLKGYVCALCTLSASVKLRRSAQGKDESVSTKHSEAILSSIVHSEVTVLEVYLHTEELRDHVEVLGNICFSQIHKSSLSEGLNCDYVLEFQNIPRGADLLTYLYVQLRDADACHHALLKYLFVHSYEPFCFFVKSWMYGANIEDPYGEFFVVPSDSDLTVNSGSSTFDKSSLAVIKERPGASIPCFLKVVCHQLLRAGQQLQVLVRLLDLCNLSFSGEYDSCDLSNLRQILPFWVDSSSKLNFLSNTLTFEESAIEALIQKRETMYRNMLEKLQSYFQTLNANDIWASPTVFACGSTSMALGRRNGSNIAFPSLSSGEAVFAQQDKNLEVVDSDSLSSTSSSESSNELESLHSSSHFPSREFNNDYRPENYSELHSSVFKRSNSMFLNLSGCHANHFRKADQVSNSFKPDTIEPPRQSDGINEEYWSGKCWPIGSLMKNPLSACMECRSLKELGSTEYVCENGARNLDSFRGDEMHLCESFSSKILEVNGSGGVQTSRGKFGQFYQPLSSGFLCGSGIKPMLVKNPWLPTIQNSSERCLINGYASNISQISFTSVKDPCKMYLQNSSSAPCYENMTEVSKTFQLRGSAGECKEYFGGPIKEILENQSVLASSFTLGETNLCAGDQHANASGGSIRDHHTNASGGSNWATLLQYPVKSCTCTDKDNHSEEKFIVPLDIIIDKCVLQEILLQYKYISCFTIKFLEEGFKLHEHLLAFYDDTILWKYLIGLIYLFCLCVIRNGLL
ncbi:hypothetical protein HPP92_019532 [Vanilla planifolia]|uniref:Gamma-tubulin complex component n=1 Tax=Vanilla planifolia TaxID=51239 RepID=A0A835UJ92_VANPL|nr:hypothetical protein HPP92_019532 [Vanilla planifolia]